MKSGKSIFIWVAVVVALSAIMNIFAESQHNREYQSIPVSDFAEDETYEDYPFRASVPLEGVIETMIPEVIFSLADSTSGLFAPVAESYNGGVHLYASDLPEADVTVPVIIFWKGNA